MSILKFLKNPEEDYKDQRITAIFLIAILYFILSIGGTVLLLLFNHAPTYTGRNLPLLCVILAGPLIEESIFRLPLRRNRHTVFFFLVVAFFILFSSILSDTIYSWHLFPVRVALSLVGSFLMYSWVLKLICPLKFNVLFYLSAFIFGMLHVANYALDVTSVSMLLFLILYVVNKFITGVILGYARLAHGFFIAVILHVINNFLPTLLQ